MGEAEGEAGIDPSEAGDGGCGGGKPEVGGGERGSKHLVGRSGRWEGLL